jgi:Ca-activated chloride channel homolog
MHIAKSGLSGILAISILLLSALSAEKNPKAPQEQDQTVIRANVDMVSLPVVVSDRAGKRITNLKKEDFQVFENGIRQEIAGFAATDEPVDVALLIDTSGSTELELARIQNAAIEFVHQLHPDDEVAVMSFAEDVKLQQDFTINRDRNEYGIKKTRSGGCTVAYEAVWLALEDVLKPKIERKALVLFTDGVDTCSAKASQKETLDLAKETRATIYSVFYDTEDDQYRRKTTGGYPTGTQIPSIIWNPTPPYGGPRSTGTTIPGGPGNSGDDYRLGKIYLSKLAEYSGGLMFDGMQDLGHAFSEVAKELASQYSIGYYSTDNKHDGKFRKIEIKLKQQGLVARTKTGYFAPKDNKK